MKTITALLTSLLILLITDANAKKIKIKYFGKISLITLCGSNDCMSSSAPFWSTVANFYYEEDPATILAHSYDSKLQSIFSRKAGPFLPSPTDIVVFNDHSINAKVQKKKKNEFNLKTSASLDTLFKSSFTLLPDAKAKLRAAIDKVVADESSKDLQLRFRIIDLKSDFQQKKTNKYLDSLPSNHRLITGIGVISIGGDWTSNVIKKILTEFEANGGTNGISGDVKANWDLNKQTLLTGNITPFSMVITHTYHHKK